MDLTIRNDRVHDEGRLAEGERREPAERDRDRLIYSAAFRRLAAVTQVVSAGERHVFHNRLTHSLEVAQIALRIAERLLRVQSSADLDAIGGLDPDVVEAAALAHDLGHPPFGHIAEEELNDAIVRKAEVAEGFEGNAQSFRIVTKLAIRDPVIFGLNLTRATLNAVSKYPWLRKIEDGQPSRKWGAYSSEKGELDFARSDYLGDERKSLEAEVMDWADDIAYSLHDVEDFYRGGLIPLDRLQRDQREADDFLEDTFARWRRNNIRMKYKEEDYANDFHKLRSALPVTEPFTGERTQSANLHVFKSELVGRFVAALQAQIPKGNGERRVVIDALAEQQVTILKELTWTYVIENPSLATQQYGQRHVIQELFRMYSEAAGAKRWSLFPRYIGAELQKIEHLDEAGPTQHRMRIRLVADLIAGMTEQQAVEMYARLTGVSLGSVTDNIL